MSPAELVDVAIAGGGLGGAAAACRLAEAGRRVVLVEREAAPARHKVCGEFLSVEAQQHLERLGLGPAGTTPVPLGGAPIDRVRLVHGSARAETDLPFPAWGLSRHRLDAWLLAQAERRGVAVRRGRAVQDLRADGAGVRLATAGGETALAADAVILATGKHELRGHRRVGAPGSDLIGLKIHLRLAAVEGQALHRHVELVLFDGGYAGLQPVEDGLANLCLLVTKARFAALGRDWRRLVAAVPHLARRLDGADPCWPRPLAVYKVPYGYLHDVDADASADAAEGRAAPVYRVGDQVAVIPSFTGDGMAIALRSAELAADAILAGRPAASFHREAVRVFAPPLRAAGLVAAAGGRPWSQAAVVAACRLAPGLLTAVARHTRIEHTPPVPPSPGAAPPSPRALLSTALPGTARGR